MYTFKWFYFNWSALIAALYRKGLIYLDTPIADDDCIIGKHSFTRILIQTCATHENLGYRSFASASAVQLLIAGGNDCSQKLGLQLVRFRFLTAVTRPHPPWNQCSECTPLTPPVPNASSNVVILNSMMKVKL